MSEPFEDRSLPRGALVAAAALIGLSMIGALAGRMSGTTATPLPRAAVVTSRDLHFSDRADGAVVVTGADGHVVRVVAPGTNGFLRGVMRGLAQERLRRSEGADTPFTLTRWSDGRLSLADPATGRNIYLEAFGPTNAAAFATLLVDDARHAD